MRVEYEFLSGISEDLHKIRGFLYSGQVIPADRNVQGVQNKLHNRMESLKTAMTEDSKEGKDAN